MKRLNKERALTMVLVIGALAAAASAIGILSAFAVAVAGMFIP